MLTYSVLVASALLLASSQDASEPTRKERNERLHFMLGEWTTVHKSARP